MKSILLGLLITGNVFASCAEVAEGDTLIHLKEKCGIPLEHKWLSLNEELYGYKEDGTTYIFDVVNMIVTRVEAEQE